MTKFTLNINDQAPNFSLKSTDLKNIFLLLDFENKTINLCRSRLGFQVGLSGQMVTVDIYLLPIVRRPRDTAVAGQ